MRRVALALGLLALGGCASSSAASSSAPPSANGTTPEPSGSSSPAAPSNAPALATGKVVVKGGEAFPLQGAIVTIGKVTYLNKPCPPGAQCLVSGIIKTVEFAVDTGSGAAPAKSVLSEGGSRVVGGTMLRVNSVTDGPQAEIEASVPVSPSPAPQ